MSELLLDLLRNRVPADKVRFVSSAKGGEYCSPCPVCGGDDRFRSWPSQDGGPIAQKSGISGTWWCRHCDKVGDAIGLLEFADGLTFLNACKELRIEAKSSARSTRPLRVPQQQQRTWEPTKKDIPSELWRKQATKMARNAHEQLLNYPKALTYLALRGIPKDAVIAHGLGFLNAEDRSGTCLYRARSAFDLPAKQNNGKKSVLWIPRGFTIPLWSPSFSASFPACGQEQEEVHRIRIRRVRGDLKDGDSKFLMLTGSGQAPMALTAKDKNLGMTVWVIVEGEMDAIAVHHACGGNIGVLAVLTNRGKPDIKTHKFLKSSPLILVALDFDQLGEKGERPGYQGWQWWKIAYPQAERWPVPVGKDPGDAYSSGLDLAAWVNAAIPSTLQRRGQRAGQENKQTDCQPDNNKQGIEGEMKTGVYSVGEGNRQKETQQNSTRQILGNENSTSYAPRRWRNLSAATPLESAVLPECCFFSVENFRNYFAGKSLSIDLLIPCPKSQPRWLWRYYKSCQKCKGHHLCILDFVTSDQMLAPETPLPKTFIAETLISEIPALQTFLPCEKEQSNV